MDQKQLKTSPNNRLLKAKKFTIIFFIFSTLSLLSVIQSVDAGTEKYASISVKNILRRHNVTSNDVLSRQNVTSNDESRKTFVSLTAECF